MPTWAVAVVAAVIGSAAAWAFAIADRFLRARREVVENDRAVAEHDEDLASWVSDRTLRLQRDMGKITSRMNAVGLFHSGGTRARARPRKGESPARVPRRAATSGATGRREARD